MLQMFPQDRNFRPREAIVEQDKRHKSGFARNNDCGFDDLNFCNPLTLRLHPTDGIYLPLPVTPATAKCKRPGSYRTLVFSLATPSDVGTTIGRIPFLRRSSASSSASLAARALSAASRAVLSPAARVTFTVSVISMVFQMASSHAPESGRFLSELNPNVPHWAQRDRTRTHQSAMCHILPGYVLALSWMASSQLPLLRGLLHLRSSWQARRPLASTLLRSCFQQWQVVANGMYRNISVEFLESRI
ncbi:hypothetical protein EDD15DRAFT_1727842 [Pisolithus albus]|nr:hypothetical protein EDD15DRAFT_1727842 [Pisolithus albus]